MKEEVIEINIYDKRANFSTTICVEKIAENIFRTTENEIFNCKLTLGTEFEARLSKDGFYEIIRIIKDSEYITRQFMLTSQFTESEYKLLADEIIRQGGFWQTDFSNIATINLPKNCKLNLDEIFKEFDFYPSEIQD